MYNYEWDTDTGGYMLTARKSGVIKEVRPVFHEELRLLGMLAREISRSTDKTFTYRDFPRDGIAETFDITYTSCTEVVKMVDDYIKISKGDYADFVKKAVCEHKTLQQSFSRLCVKWFDIYAQVNYSSKDDIVIAVRKILTFDTSLPFI